MLGEITRESVASVSDTGPSFRLLAACSPRGQRIAWMAFRFGLLSRAELRHPDKAERVERTLGYGDLAAFRVINADELDRLCGYAVAVLQRPSAPPGPVLDLLGVLDPDRLLGILYALPTERREAVARRDRAWDYHAARAPDDIDAALAAIGELEDVTRVGWELALQLENQVKLDGQEALSPEHMRREGRRYMAGLPADLTDDERAMIKRHAGR